MTIKGAPPEHVRRVEKTMTLPCVLTATEFVERAQDLARTTSDIAEETARGESLKTQLKAALSELESRRTRLSSVVARKEEFREVRVTVISDYEAGRVFTMREDTGEVFDERTMRADERQVPAAL